MHNITQKKAAILISLGSCFGMGIGLTVFLIGIHIASHLILITGFLLMCFLPIIIAFIIQENQQKQDSSLQIKETVSPTETLVTKPTTSLSQNTSSLFKQVRTEGLLDTLRSRFTFSRPK